MGVVVEARHLQLDERVALKFLTAEWATHPEAAERFLREARAAVRIKNEHVARVSDVGTLDTGSPYMVMEYLEGKDLGQILEKTGPMQLLDAVDYLIQGCEAIAEAHGMGIVHRDLKPANLFLTKHPDGSPLVKVLDFGISKQTGGAVDNLTRTTATMGSALYMSPEQMQQSRNVDHRTDVYALGVTLYELLAGKQPYYAETLPQLCAEILTGTPTPLRDLRPDIPPDFAFVLEKAYARDRNIRYQNIAEYVFALAPYAPPRSQGSIDRVARLSGMQPPQAGAPPAVPPGPLGQPGGDRLVVGAYSAAPPSARAAAAFASSPEIGHGQMPYGPSTGHPGYQSSGSLGSHALGTSQVSPPPKSKTPVVIAAVLAALLGCAVALYLVGGLGKPGPSEPTNAGSAIASATPPAPPPPPSAETAKPETSATPPPSTSATEPPAPASADPSAATSVSAPPPANNGRRPPIQTGRPPPPPPKATTPTPSPAPTPKSGANKDPFGDR
jgi:hypothetical protein